MTILRGGGGVARWPRLPTLAARARSRRTAAAKPSAGSCHNGRGGIEAVLLALDRQSRYDRRHSEADRMALLTVRNLSVWFETRDGTVCAVNDVSFTLEAGQVLALLGESGSGKSVTLRAILGLHHGANARTKGEVIVKGQDVLRLDERAREALRGGVVSLVFQEPMTALDPVYTIGEQIAETLARHRPQLDRAAVRRRARELLDLVQVPSPERCLASYPHAISGGMRQRAMI